MRSSRFLAVGTLALILMGAVTGCGQMTTPARQSAQSAVQQTPLQPLQLIFEIDRLQYTKPEEFCNGPLVAEVIVGAHGDARWNTSDGKRPPLATSGEIVRAGDFIYAPVTFSSFTALRVHGLAPGAAFMTIGGQVGQDVYRYGDYPQLPGSGGHYILVITTPAPRQGMTPVDTLLVAYTFPVDASGKVTIQRAGDPNEPGVGPVQPEIAVALSDLKATLVQCAA